MKKDQGEESVSRIWECSSWQPGKRRVEYPVDESWLVFVRITTLRGGGSDGQSKMCQFYAIHPVDHPWRRDITSVSA